MKALVSQLQAKVTRFSPLPLFLTAVAYVLVIAIVDLITPEPMSFTLLYLLGITFVGWSCGPWQACLLAAFSAGLISYHEGVYSISVLVWNIVTRLVVFSAFGLLTAKVTRLTRSLSHLVDQRTRRWQAEAEQHRLTSARLAETLQSFETQAWILQNMGEAMIATDSEGRIELMNPAAEKLTGYSLEELRGQSVALLSPVGADEGSPRLDQLLADPGAGGQWSGEVPVRRKDGSQWVAQVTLSGIEIGGKLLRVGLYQDVTARNAAETELRNREGRLRLGLEAARMLTWDLDVLTGQIHCSENLPEFVGGPDVEAFQSLTTWLERVHPEDRPGLTAALEQALRSPGLLEHESRSRHLDGSYHWVLIKGRAVTDASGRALRLRGVTLDVTERKNAELLMEAQRDLAIGLGVTTELKAGLDRLLQIALRIAGIDCGGVYLVDPRSKGLHLTAYCGVSEAFARGAADYPSDTAEAQLLRQQRPIYSLYTDLQRTANPAREPEGLKAAAVLPLVHEGELLGCLNLASHAHTDISAQTRIAVETIAAQAAGAIARIRAETALHESQERMRMIIQGAPIVLFAGDRDGVIQFEDGQALKALGVAAGANVGRPLGEAYAQFPVVVEHMQRALAGEVFSTEFNMGPVSFYGWYSPTRGPQGHINGYIGVATDVTERHLLERQLLEISDREQARIGQEIHDGLCQQLVSLAFDANALRRQLSARRLPEAKAAQRLAAYLDAAITESRQLSRGLFPIRLETEGLPSALEELARSTADRFRVRCEFQNTDAVTVPNQTVATHLYRIAQEAVSNAVKHSRAGSIRITLGRGASGLALSVMDDGVGFAENTAPNGGGMGLHIMDYRARRIGGVLQRHSGPGAGTVISCCAPDHS